MPSFAWAINRSEDHLVRRHAVQIVLAVFALHGSVVDSA